MKVSELYLHPIKSCKPIRVKSAKLGEFGFENDRKWMVITQDNRYQGLKHNAKFWLVNQEIDDTEGMPKLRIPLHPDSEEKSTPFKVELFKQMCDVVDEGKEASDWFTKFLVPPEKQGTTVLRLVRNFPVHTKRPSESQIKDADSVIMFADAFPILMISQASMDGLNERLEKPIAVTRFRPNIVVDGKEAYPHIEDDWQQIEINSITYKIAEPCVRCKVPTATEAGIYDPNSEPTTTLKKYRAVKQMVFFGNYFFHTARGTISEGDEIKVVTSTPWTVVTDANKPTV